eukprot:g9210.t1
MRQKMLIKLKQRDVEVNDLSEKCVTLQTDLDRFRREKDAAVNEHNQLLDEVNEERLRLTMLEREDVTKAYRVACEERARLEQTVEDLAGQRATMTLRLQEAGTELAQLRGRLREEKKNELIASLRDQIKLLKDQLNQVTKERDQLKLMLETAKVDIMEQERRSKALSEMANKYEKDLEGRTQGGVVEGKE